MQVSAGTKKDAVKEKVRGRWMLVPGRTPSIWVPRYGLCSSCTGTCIYCTVIVEQLQTVRYKLHISQLPNISPHASCAQLPWFRFPFNFPALPWNFSARMVEWIELVDPGPRSSKLHSKRKIPNNNIYVSLPLQSL